MARTVVGLGEGTLDVLPNTDNFATVMLHRFWNNDSVYYPDCNTPEETSEHAVCYCPRFIVEGSKTEVTTGIGINAENIVDVILKS